MNVSLYEISADFLKALDGLEVDEETGEIVIMNFDAVGSTGRPVRGQGRKRGLLH